MTQPYQPGSRFVSLIAATVTAVPVVVILLVVFGLHSTTSKPSSIQVRIGRVIYSCSAMNVMAERLPATLRRKPLFIERERKHWDLERQGERYQEARAQD